MSLLLAQSKLNITIFYFFKFPVQVIRLVRVDLFRQNRGYRKTLNNSKGQGSVESGDREEYGARALTSSLSSSVSL